MEGAKVAGFEEEALEFGVEVSFQCLVPWGEDCDIVVSHCFFQFLKEKGFLDEFSEFGVMGIQKGHEDGVGIDLT